MGGLETQSREYVVARGIHKHFGGVHALSDVSLSIERGTIHGLVGENGAGKSTFGKLVAGFYSPDDGQLIIDGEPVRFRSPRDALLAGITIVGQERNVVPQRSVLDNVFLGRENAHLRADQPEGDEESLRGALRGHRLRLSPVTRGSAGSGSRSSSRSRSCVRSSATRACSIMDEVDRRADDRGGGAAL